jgi:hypothetical protein
MAQAPEPFKSNLKEMTMHPFVEFSDMLDLIVNDTTNLASNVFDDLKPRLLNKGLILGGNKDHVEYQYQRDYSGQGYSSDKFWITNFLGDIWNPIVFPTYFTFRLSDILTENITINANIILDFELNVNKITLCRLPDGSDNEDVLSIINGVSVGGGWYSYDLEISVDISKGYDYYFSILPEDSYYIQSGGHLTINYTIKTSLFASGADYEFGHYNCLLNLPEMTFAEFIQQMLIMTGMFIGYDKNGDIRFISFDDLKDNVQSGTAYNRSGRIGEITKNEYRFENFAQRNIIKFNNSDDVGYVAHGELTVNDLTLEKERDMYVIKFDLAEQSADGKAEFILYKQRVTENEKGGEIETGFENNYSEKPSVCVYDHSGRAIINNIVPNSYTEEEESIGMVVPIGITDEFTITSVYDTYVSVSESIAGLSGSFLLYAINSSYIWFENIIITGYSGTYIYLDTTSLGLSMGDKIQLCLQSTNKLYLEPLLYPKEVGDYITLSGNDYIITEIGVDQNEVSIATNSFYISDFSYNIKITHKITGFIEKYYGVMQKIIERPRVIECEDNMDVITSANIDYEKPFYADELGGRYAVLLELQAPNNEPCVAKLLLINQKL